MTRTAPQHRHATDHHGAGNLVHIKPNELQQDENPHALHHQMSQGLHPTAHILWRNDSLISNTSIPRASNRFSFHILCTHQCTGEEDDCKAHDDPQDGEYPLGGIPLDHPYPDQRHSHPSGNIRSLGLGPLRTPQPISSQSNQPSHEDRSTHDHWRFRTFPGTEVCHLAGIEQFQVLIELSLMRQATRWDSEALSNPTPIQTHPSRLSTTQKLYATLIDKISALRPALDRPTWRSTIKDWYNERMMLEFDKLNPSWGRKELPWGPFAWHPRWIFRKFKRRDLSFLAQFLLDHWRSQVYLHRIHPQESPLCRPCQATHETREHILRCHYTQHLRQRHLPHSPHLSALNKQLKNRKTLCQLSQFLQGLHQLWDPQIGI